MNKIQFSKYNTNDLLDRRALQSLRDAIFNEIEAVNPGTVIGLDLSNIHWINSSGVDEVIGSALRLIKESQREVFLFLETEANQYEHDFNLQKALHDAEMPIMVRIVREEKVEAKAIGPLNAYLERILDLVYSSTADAGITSSDAAGLLQLGKSMCSTSLGKLFEMRLVRRVRITIGRGYEYRYFPLF